jgi:paraquat-inducible protein A
LERGTSGSPHMALAVAVTAAELWLLMNVFPLVRLSIEGISRETTLAGAAMSFFAQGMPALSVLVALTAIAAPGLEIGLAIYLLVRVEDLRRRGRLGAVVRWLGRARRWSMVDVFLLGCMVAIVKLSHLAQLVTGPALWASAALIPLLALLNLYLEPRRLALAVPS